MSATLVFENQDLMHNNPRLSMERISIEANHLHNLVEVFKNYLPALVNDLTTMVSNLKEDDYSKYAQDIFSKSARASYKAQHLDYLSYGETHISVPEGFSGHFIPYGHTLTNVTDTITARLSNLLSQINTYMSVFISNKDQQISMKDMDHYYQSVNKELDEIKNQLSKFFTQNRHISKAPIKDILARMADVNELKKVVEVLDKKHSKINIKSLSQNVQQTIDLANIILHDVKSASTTAISPAVGKSISQGLFYTGRYIELVSAIYYDIIVYMTSIDKLYDKLIEA